MAATAGLDQATHPRTRSRSRRAEVNATEYDRDPLDFYIEDEWCWQAIFAKHKFIGPMWDPWAGSGTVKRVRKAMGHGCYSTDIVDRGPHLDYVCDFLKHDGGTIHCANICGNPPYGQPYAGIGLDMALRALDLATHQVCMLFQQKFQSGPRRWRRLLENHRPRAIYIFADRPNMPPGDLFLAGKVKRGGGSKDYIAIVWDKTYNGPTTTDWLFDPGKAAGGLNGTAKKAAAPGGV